MICLTITSFISISKVDRFTKRNYELKNKINIAEILFEIILFEISTIKFFHLVIQNEKYFLKKKYTLKISKTYL